MNFGTLKNEIELAVQDSSLYPYFGEWLNNAVLEIASDFDLPDLKLKTPTALTVSSSQWLYDMPSDYHKKCFKCRTSDGYSITVLNKIEDIDAIDFSHDTVDTSVKVCAVEDGKIAIYPMADTYLNLWYFRLPVPMVSDTDEPDGIPPQYAERVLIPKVLLKCFRLLTDMTMQQPHQSIAYWEMKYREGLYGSPGGDVGMIHYFAKLKGVKVGSSRHRSRYI